MTVPSADLGPLLSELQQERAQLVDLLRPLPEEAWLARPPTGNWTVADHITQLALLDEAATVAVTAPKRFATHARARLSSGPSSPGDIDARARARPGPGLLDWLSRTQRALIKAYRNIEPDHRLPWYGTELDARTSVIARLTETWAHGRDLADALNVAWTSTDRLHLVADLGVRGLASSFEMLGRPVPTVPVWIELTAPGGELWRWGSEHARDRVIGSAEDLCLVLTGRRAAAETGLTVTGAVVGEWLVIGRVYPGAPDIPGGRRTAGAEVY
jgi:uncharacterized protein (TIGR03084 family)